MNYLNVNVSYKVFWQFKDLKYLKVTKCKKIINCKTGTILKYNQRGYFINGKYLKKNQINKLIEPIPNELPF